VIRLLNKVRLYRAAWTWLRSWWSFLVGIGFMAAFWYGCYLLVNHYAEEHLIYFKWGAYLALGLMGFLLVFNEPIVVLATGAERVRDWGDCHRLYKAVKRATPWYAKPTPRIYLLPSSGMNAISFGWGIHFFSAVGDTRGAVNKLSEEELAAVMAHEVGHVINKDILISMAMTLTVMIMALTGYLLIRVGPYSSGRRSSSSKNSGLALLVLLLVGFVMYVFGRLVGLILQAFVSSQREYAADATSARLMGSSEPLISALRTISRDPKVGRLGSQSVEAAVGFLCTADPNPSDMMSTHPALERRLRALEVLEM